MKPAQFEYSAPGSVEEAVSLLDEDAKVLAGGQSLVPLLNFRLARPARLVDVNGVESLAGVHEAEGTLRIGAMTRHAALERSQLVADGWPLLAQAVRFVGHAQIRSRGTVGGSAAHADPAAELPAALLALDARMRVRSPAGERTLPAAELWLGPLTTALEADELLVEIEVAPLPKGARSAFCEHARTHGDFAQAGVAAILAPGAHAAIALMGVGPTPVRAAAAERALLEGAGAREAAHLAAEAVRDPWKRALLAELARRALVEVGA